MMAMINEENMSTTASASLLKPVACAMTSPIIRNDTPTIAINSVAFISAFRFLFWINCYRGY